MIILLTIVHVLVCLFLIIVVLLQSGKAADLAGAFGGMGSQTAFGPRGSATLLSKATTVTAILFMVTSLSLSIIATRNAGTGSTVLEGQSGQQATPAPAPGGVAPGQPSMTITPEGGGPSRTIPLDIPAQPPAGQSQQQPAKKK
ncbi:MAG: preprotein translocase subunit SecG [Bryobacteraceae bacterium]